MDRVPPIRRRKSISAAIGFPVLGLAIIYTTLFIAPRLLSTEGASQLSPEQSHKLDELGVSLLKQAKFAEALQPLTDLHQAYPNSHVYVERLANVYHHLGRFEDEAKCWEQYMDVAPTPITACPRIGRAYELSGAGHRAIDAFQRCLNLDPTNTDSIFYLATALEQAGQPEPAEARYKQGLALSPQYTDMKIGLIRTKLDEGRIAEGLSDAQKLIGESPNNSEAVLLLGQAYFISKQFADAKTTLEHGAELAPRDPDFALSLAQVADAEHRPEEAKLLYAHVLELDPRNELARARLQPNYFLSRFRGLVAALRRIKG